MAGLTLDNFQWMDSSAQIQRRYLYGASGGSTIGIGPSGRNGENALEITGSYSAYVQRTLSGIASNTGYMAFDFKISNGVPTPNFFAGLMKDAGIQAGLRIKTDRTIQAVRGTVSVLATSSYVVPIGQVIRFGLRVQVDHTLGEFELRVWEDPSDPGAPTITVFHLSGLDTQEWTAGFDGFHLGACVNGTTTYGHLAVCDGSGTRWNKLSDIGAGAAVLTSLADGAGASTQWTPNTGSNYAAVDDAAADDDTTYVSDSASSDRDLYTFSDVPTDIDLGFAQVLHIAKRVGGSGSNHLTQLIRQNTTVTSLTAQSVGTTDYDVYESTLQLAPDSSIFTPTIWNALQWGQDRGSDAGDIRVTQIVALVLQTGPEVVLTTDCTSGMVPMVADPSIGVSFHGLGPHVDRVFVEIDLDDGTVSYALQTPMNDSADLENHPGRKEGRIVSIGSVIRRTTDHFGSWQASGARFTLDDGDRAIRTLIAAGQWFNREARIYVCDRSDVSNALCIFCGIITDYPSVCSDDGLTVDVQLADIIATDFSPLSLDRDILSGAVYDSSRVPNAPRELLDQKPPKPIPIYGGLWSDEASDVDPPVLIGSAARGASLNQIWIMGFDNMPSGPGTPSNLTAVVASGGSINAADSPYATLYAQVWGVDGSGNAGDPYPYLPTGLPITITGTGKKVTLTVTASFTPALWRFALATKYYGARWMQILEVPGGTTSVDFTVHPVFQGGFGFTSDITPGAFLPILERRCYRVVAIVGGARTGPSANCLAYENTPYYRPIHVSWLPVAGVDSYEVYACTIPNSPFGIFNRKWDVAITSDSDGYHYFNDDFSDSGVSFVDGITAPVGVLPLEDTGDEVIDGVQYGRLILMRWACREIIGVYAGGIRLADDHPDILHQDHSAWPFLERTRLIGDVDCTVVYAKGVLLEHHRDGTAKLQVNACTIEETGDGTGNGITQACRLTQHLVTELILNDHKVGVWDGIPIFANGVPKVRTSSYAAAELNQIARIGGTGYTAKIALTKSTTVRDFFGLICQSFRLRHGITRYGQVTCGELDVPVADIDATRHYADSRPVGGSIPTAGHLIITPVTSALETQISSVHGFRPVTDDFSSTDDRLPLDADLPTDPAVIANRGHNKLSQQPRTLHFVDGSDAIDDVKLRTLTEVHYVRDFIEIPSSIEGLSDDLFDAVRITDDEGVGATGYSAELVRITEHEIILPDPAQGLGLSTVLRGTRVGPILDELA